MAPYRHTSHKNGLLYILDRIRTQGLQVTLAWVYARGLPLITGIPVMKYSQITPQIYVGPQYRLAGKRRLESLGIRASLNLRDEFDDRAYGLNLEQHCYLPTLDNHAPTMHQLEQGNQFIQQILAQSGKVYIHCRGGIGRAPTMTAAYLLQTGLTLEEAIRLIKETRPFIKIMPLQLQRLREFETIKRNAMGGL
jgi:protein-tyrosine phosphatase